MDSQPPESNTNHDIDTSGGAYVGTSVYTGGGDFVGRDKITIEQATIYITQIRRDDQPKGWDGREPYVGLGSFRENQADLFFGREKLVARLIEKLKETRFLCISGPSGSGKSSLVQAGMIPALRANKITGSNTWLIETLTPGNRPLENLALAMGRLAKSPEAAAHMRSYGPSDPATLHAQVETLLTHDPEQRAVIVVDQFEELFTQTKDETSRQQFLNLLTRAAQQVNGRVIVLLVMRSDFVSQCATYPDLRKLISGHIELVGAMEPEELAHAIALPALEVGVEVKPDLVVRVINDMAGEPGALPLMEFALADLFAAHPKHKGQFVELTLKTYQSRGGIQQALERHAEAAFNKLSIEQQEIARTIFMRLIEVGRGIVDTRRTATFAELVPSSIDAGQVETVVQSLSDARLITTDDEHQIGQDNVTRRSLPTPRTVTLAHEKLIEVWPWLQQLVRENRRAIELQNQLDGDAIKWESNQHDASYLYTGARLQTVKEQLATSQIALNSLAQKFIGTSVQEEEIRRKKLEETRQLQLRQTQALADARQRELHQTRVLAEEQRKRAEEQTTANVRLRKRAQLLRAVIGLLVISVVFASWFGVQSNQNAKEARNQGFTAQAVSTIALQEKSTAEAASTIALEQQAIAEMEKQRADEKAQEAAKAVHAQATEIVQRRTAEANAEARRQDAEQERQIAVARQLAAQAQLALDDTDTGLIQSVALSVESLRRYPSLEGDQALRQGLTLLPKSVPQTVQEEPVYAVTFNLDKKSMIQGSWNNSVWEWEANTGQEIVRYVHGSDRKISALSPDGQRIVSVALDNTILVQDVTTGQEIARMVDESNVLAVAFSPNGKWIVSGSRDGMTQVWNATTGEAISYMKHDSPVNFVVFSPNGMWIASGSEGEVEVWLAATRKEIFKYLSTGVLTDLAFSPDVKWLALSRKDGILQVLEAATGREISQMQHQSEIRAISFSPNGKWVASASDDATARVWETATGREVIRMTHPASVTAVVFSPDGKWVATGGADNTGRVWEAATGKDRNVSRMVRQKSRKINL